MFVGIESPVISGLYMTQNHITSEDRFMLGLEIAFLVLVISGVLLVGICGIAYSIFLR